MDTRQAKGLEIAARSRVVHDADGWLVPSLTGSDKYRVDATALTCSCPDFETRRLPCKHIHAVRFVAEREGGADAPPTPPSAPPAAAKRPTYAQDWTAYNRAQAAEKHRFQVLLAELCRGVPEPPRVNTGRKPIPRSDAAFSAAFKVYSTVSSRRFDCDLKDAHAAGHLTRSLHHNKVNSFLEDPLLTPILYRLIEESCRPLAAVERDFAADSSAFTTSKFIRWFDVKHGKMKSEHVWVKVQIMCGVRTNVVTAIEVCDKDGPDAPYMPRLVASTAERFTIGEVSADKGYSAIASQQAIIDAGGEPFVAFRKNATGGSGGLWERTFHYFQYRREEFLAHYHKRSNVESVFSAVKRKFGDSLRSKTRDAMVNELLCKFLSHNVCVLIQEQEELGVAAEFWGRDVRPDADRDEPCILRFPGA